MSLFRSAAEISSSDPESSSEESEYEEMTSSYQGSNKETKIVGGGGEISEPASSSMENETDSYESIHQDGGADFEGVPDLDAEGHATVMTAALLEFYCLTRAADILNSQPGSHGRFTRDSPEVQYLGKKLYNYKSHFLSSHGVLANGIDGEEWGPTRQYYRDSLDVLGAAALEGANLNPPVAGPSSRAAIKDSALSSKTSTNKRLMASSKYARSERREAQDSRTWDLQKLLPGGGNPNNNALMGSLRNLLQPSPTLFPASPPSFPLLNAYPEHPSNRLSRYAVEFTEVKMLGRGSFGEVYHVKNHVDGQSYAVKKIPISRRRLEQLQQGGLQQLEQIMKEIRTLARLEHINVVRYYGAWVEHANTLIENRSLGGPSRMQSEIGGSQQTLMSPDSTEAGTSFNVVFEHSEEHTDDGIVFEEDSKSASFDGGITSSSNDLQRRISHATTASSRSRKSSAHSVAEDEEIESIPRDFSVPSHSLMSTLGGSDGDIFTDGLSEDMSKLAVRRRAQQGSQAPAVILHIQMSLHPLSLSTYLNPQTNTKEEDGNSPSRRHCFHIIPSMKIILGILSGVEYLHSKGIVHRDLKPANIFLSIPGDNEIDQEGCPRCKSECATATTSPQYYRPRIGDFGLVADLSNYDDTRSPHGGALTSFKNDTMPIRHVGTEFYCPPVPQFSPSESGGRQLHSHNNRYTIDEKLDVFALGVILFELLYRLNTKMERQMVLAQLTRGTGRERSSGSDGDSNILPSDFAAKVDSGGTTLDDSTSIAESLSTCIKGMLEHEPQKRWSCKDIRRCLESVLHAARKHSE
ncbi:hypothetical protein VTN00DRAFT_4003 [Thermoascus crustaceus]|uniref:uncharacterized protein n=1 Tax=Thermoascus crustaceus TaxID=5088 RepID=UPI003743D61F